MGAPNIDFGDTSAVADDIGPTQSGNTTWGLNGNKATLVKKERRSRPLVETSRRKGGTAKGMQTE